MPDWICVLLEATSVVRGGRAGLMSSTRAGWESAQGGASLEDWLQEGFLEVFQQQPPPATHAAAVEAVVSAALRRRDSHRRRCSRHQVHHEDLLYRALLPAEQSSAQLDTIMARDVANKIYDAIKDDGLAERIMREILRNGVPWHDTQGLAAALDVKPEAIKRKKDYIVRRAGKIVPEMQRRRQPGGRHD